jgi:hypothetical protein
MATTSLSVSLQATQPRPLAWLWPGRMAAGRLTLIDGDPGQGKSLLAIDIAARLTSGREMPDGFRPEAPAAVVLLSGEDGMEDTVLPRLLAAGGDVRRTYRWPEEAGPLVFPQACAALGQMLRDTAARLVIFDPFFAFLGQEVSSLNDLMIRRALAPLMGVAEETQASLLLIRHLGKDESKQAAYRGLGSIAILGVARTAFLVGPDPVDPKLHVLACMKSNLAAMPPSLGFRIVSAGDGRPRLEWQGEVPRTADDLVAPVRRRGEAVPRAVCFLQERLAAGFCNRQVVLEEAARLGISFRTLERAKQELWVVSRQRREEGRNVWYWGLRECELG